MYDRNNPAAFDEWIEQRARVREQQRDESRHAAPESLPGAAAPQPVLLPSSEPERANTLRPGSDPSRPAPGERESRLDAPPQGVMPRYRSYDLHGNPVPANLGPVDIEEGVNRDSNEPQYVLHIVGTDHLSKRLRGELVNNPGRLGFDAWLRRRRRLTHEVHNDVYNTDWCSLDGTDEIPIVSEPADIITRKHRVDRPPVIPVKFECDIHFNVSGDFNGEGEDSYYLMDIGNRDFDSHGPFPKERNMRHDGRNGFFLYEMWHENQGPIWKIFERLVEMLPSAYDAAVKRARVMGGPCIVHIWHAKFHGGKLMLRS